MQTVGLTKSFGARTLFEGVAFQVGPGDRLAVVGRNGRGKTTLLRCLVGQIAPDAGDIVTPRGSTVALHDQRPPLDRDVSLGDYIAEGLTAIHATEAQLRALEQRMAAGDHGPEVMGAYDRTQRTFERLGGYEAQSWLERVQRGLGIDPEWGSRPLRSFSGGEITRASLARALVARPDVLLLDEPTNHLDLQSVEWLETALTEIGAGIIIVSHDRWFLESVATSVLDLDARAKLWPMGYSRFRRAKAEALARQAQLAAAQAIEIARLERFVERWRAGTKARQAQSRAKRLAKIERIDVPRRERSLAFGFPKTEQAARIVIDVDNLDVGVGGNVLIQGASFAIERGQRVAVVGPNGAGKTTLIETLIGRRAPMSGRVGLGHRVSVAYFSQHAEELRSERTVIETVLVGADLTNTQARTLLGGFLFPADMVERKVEMLSGGERRRLSLVQLIANGGNLLVLDEPTNHLDIESREAVEDALDAFDGTVLFVSHDRALIDLMATHTLELVDGTVTMRHGGYTDLLEARQLVEHDPGPPRPPRKPVVAATPQPATKPAPPRRRLREVARLEAAISALESEREELATKLADPDFTVDRDAVTSAGERYKAVEEELAWSLSEWEKAAEE